MNRKVRTRSSRVSGTKNKNMNTIVLQKGQIFDTLHYGQLEIIEEVKNNIPIKKYNTQIFKIKFLETGTIKEVSWQDIRRGKVSDYNLKSICGVACLGEGKYKSDDRNYLRWKALINRCYNIKDNKYSSYGKKGIKVCEEWKNFQNFAKWIEENNKYNIDIALDKDVIANINHLEGKIYSPETCLLIPHNINGFLAGDGVTCGVSRVFKGWKANLSYEGQKYNLGIFKDWKDAKIAYSNKKQECWEDLLNKSDISEELKEILLQYDFSWYWLWR